MDNNAAFWIEKLQLKKHQEGGYYRENFRSGLLIDKSILPISFHGNRNACTSIYFLLEKNEFSAFHRIASDELWHFYSGSPMNIYEIEKDGKLTIHHLGNNIEAGENFQVAIKAGNWFASALMHNDGYALVGCTVSPGFDFEDFELAERKSLIKEYPEHENLITSLTRV